MKDIFNQLKQSFKNGDILTRMIFINVGVYFTIVTFQIVFVLFVGYEIEDVNNIVRDFLAFPNNNLNQIPFRLHTIITHMFMHIEFMHIVPNMMMLYYLGKFFLSYFTPKKFLGLYFLGGFSGLILAELIIQISPKYVYHSFGYGASAAVMTIVIAICTYIPKAEIRPFGLFSVKLVYVGIGLFLLDYLFLMKENTGGHIAHIGGAATGYLFATSQKKGKDITTGINYVISGIVNLFKPRSKMKVVHSQESVQNMTDDEYSKSKSYSQKEIDKILDKISASGYESLSKQEKKDLYNFSNNK
jgi:membrane associated rhomboid family serine protease